MSRTFKFNGFDLFLLLVIAVSVLVPGSGITPTPPQPSTPLTACYVIYESKQQATIADVLGGKTAQALRDAGKWKSWDKDDVPASKTRYLDLAKAWQPKDAKDWVPWCVILHGEETTYNGRFPTKEPEFVDLVAKQGGM